MPTIVIPGYPIAPPPRRRRADRARRPRDGRAVREERGGARGETREDRRGGGAPRGAGTGAYAGRERVPAAHGPPRGRFGAPNESLPRFLAALTRRSRAAEVLTEL